MRCFKVRSIARALLIFRELSKTGGVGGSPPGSMLGFFLGGTFMNVSPFYLDALIDNLAGCCRFLVARLDVIAVLARSIQFH